MGDRVLEVAFPAARDIGEWERRHERGEVPSRWPYGLDALGRPGVDLRSRPIPAPSRTDVVRRVVAGLPRSRVSGLVRVAWDENTANQMSLLRPDAARFAGVIWLTDRVARDGSDPYRRLIARLGGFDGLWVLSRAQVAPLSELLGRDAPPIDFVRFGVDERFFAAAPPPARPMVLSAGGDRDRDTDTLFGALERVHAAMPSARLVVQTTSARTAPPGVEVLPHVPHARLAELYRESSVVAVATRPNLHVSGMTVSLEAMATARPVVVTDSPGFDDYVRDGVDGLRTPQGDDAQLAAGILSLLRDPAAAARMGADGRAAVEAGMTTRHLTDAITGLIDRAR